jgi:hypothetical protein
VCYEKFNGRALTKALEISGNTYESEIISYSILLKKNIQVSNTLTKYCA